MPFDPTKPAANSPFSSQEIRDQLNGLKDLIDAVPAGPQGPAGEVTNGQFAQAIADTARNPQTTDLGVTLSDPPTASEVGMIVNKLNELLGALRR